MEPFSADTEISENEIFSHVYGAPFESLENLNYRSMLSPLAIVCSAPGCNVEDGSIF